nr:MAG TPA: hypothetical protein [Caudoviricetes sp.]
MERLTEHSKQTSHENGICCTHCTKTVSAAHIFAAPNASKLAGTAP